MRTRALTVVATVLFGSLEARAMDPPAPYLFRALEGNAP